MRNELRKRNILFVMVLTSISLGLYMLYLMISISMEYRETIPEKKQISGPSWLLILLFSLGLAIPFWQFSMLSNDAYLYDKIGNYRAKKRFNVLKFIPVICITIFCILMGYAIAINYSTNNFRESILMWLSILFAVMVFMQFFVVSMTTTMSKILDIYSNYYESNSNALTDNNIMTHDIDSLIAEQNNKIAEIASLALQYVNIETDDILFWANVTRTSSELGMLIKVDKQNYDEKVLYESPKGSYYITRMDLFAQEQVSREYFKEVFYPIDREIAEKIRDLREFMVENFGENNNFSWITLRMDKETLYEYKFEYEPFHNDEFLEKHHLLGWCDIGSYIPYEELGIYMNGEDFAKDFIKSSIKAKKLWNKEHNGN